MPLVKATMVLLYWRLFNSLPKMRYALYLTGAALMAWNIGALFAGIFQCSPIRRYWNKETSGHCLNGLVYFRAIASTNLVTDVVVLALPLPIVWKLQRPIGEKLALSGIFLLGALYVSRLVCAIDELS